VRSLVEAMGGAVWVASEPGRGTTLTFVLDAFVPGKRVDRRFAGAPTSIDEFMRQIGVVESRSA
jgi:hypothetical protein